MRRAVWPANTVVVPEMSISLLADLFQIDVIVNIIEVIGTRFDDLEKLQLFVRLLNSPETP